MQIHPIPLKPKDPRDAIEQEPRRDYNPQTLYATEFHRLTAKTN